MTCPPLTLAMVNPGETVRLVDIKSGYGLIRRLADMGLTRGVSFKVINTQRPGPVIIELRGSRLVLGHGVTQKILVSIDNND